MWMPTPGRLAALVARLGAHVEEDRSPAGGHRGRALARNDLRSRDGGEPGPRVGDGTGQALRRAPCADRARARGAGRRVSPGAGQPPRAFSASFAPLLDQRYDAILTPTASGTAPAGLQSTGEPTFCALWTLCGMPALSLPLLRGANGLPLGVQLVGPRHGDARLLRTARWLVDLAGC